MKATLNTAQKKFFGRSKQCQINGYTVKYFFSEFHNGIRFMIFNGKGTGGEVAGSSNWNDVTAFCLADKKPVYRTIFSKKDGRKGGTYFFSETDSMVFSDHPFVSEGWNF